jgi:TerC family integral membrane protein
MYKAAKSTPPRDTSVISKLRGGSIPPPVASSNSILPLSSRGGSGKTASSDEYAAALGKTFLTLLAATAFGLALIPLKGAQSSIEFFSGYVVEQSLSVDNIFVFILLFDYFKVPTSLQPLVLSWGIWGAVVMRGIMIMAGVSMLSRARSVLLVFAGVLVASGIKLLSEGSEEEHSMDDNAVLKIANWIMPSSKHYDGNKFFTRDGKTGRMLATPLLTCLICIELSDFVFAIDSIPAGELVGMGGLLIGW